MDSTTINKALTVGWAERFI